MSVVYAATDIRLKRAVAVKVAKSSGSLDFGQRVNQEARSLALLSHPNIVAIHDIGITARHRPFIVMEFIDGETLATKVKRGPLPASELVPLVPQLLAGLAEVHRLGIIHRDIKPSNALVESNRLKISDFGIALAPSADRVTETGVLVGTRAYMAPEVLQGHYYPASDIFSAGITLYELLIGQLPTRSSDGIHVETHPDLQWLSAAIFACTRTDPHQRPTAEMLWEKLRRSADTRAIGVFGKRSTEHDLLDHESTLGGRTPQTQSWRRFQGAYRSRSFQLEALSRHIGTVGLAIARGLVLSTTAFSHRISRNLIRSKQWLFRTPQWLASTGKRLNDHAKRAVHRLLQSLSQGTGKCLRSCLEQGHQLAIVVKGVVSMCTKTVNILVAALASTTNFILVFFLASWLGMEINLDRFDSPKKRGPVKSVFYDDFEDVNQGWPEQAANGLTLEIDNGVYDVVVDAENAYTVLQSPQGLELGSTVSRLRGNFQNASELGLTCLENGPRGYYLVVSSEGTFKIIRRDENLKILREGSFSPDLLGEVTTIRAGCLLRRDSKNVVLKLGINGLEVGRTTDRSVSARGVNGMFVGTDGPGPGGATIQDFVVFSRIDR